MCKRNVLLRGALMATLLVAVLAGAAVARRIELSSQNWKAVWPETERLLITNGTEPANETVRIACNVTLEGSFHSRTISKVCGSLIGYVTKVFRAPKETCANREMTEDFFFLSEHEGTMQTLPWHVQYVSFAGTLPTISGITIQIINMSFVVSVRELGGRNVMCLYQSSAMFPAVFTFNVNTLTQKITGLHAAENRELPNIAGGLSCPMKIFIKKTATNTRTSGAVEIVVRLVA